MRVQRDDFLVETITEVCNLYFRSVLLPKGIAIEQHVHSHDHANFCASGSAEYWEDRVLVRTVKAGEVIEVKAGKYHAFVALEDETRLVCVHDIASAESLKAKGL